MLSQVRSRISLPNATLRYTVERALSVCPAKLKSKNDGSDDRIDDAFGISSGVSEPMKRQPRLNSNSEVDPTLNDLLFKPNKPKFEHKKKREINREKLSQMKPGRLRSETQAAAKNIAAKVGADDNEVYGDIMSKLDSVFEPPSRKKKVSRQNIDVNTEPIGATSIPDNFDTLFDDAVFKPPPKASYPESSQRSSRQLASFKSINELLKSQPGLDIFSPDLKAPAEQPLKYWQKFEEMELQRMTRFEPLNWFDQCIMWTEEGKLWRFPIDNEQDMAEEANVDFSEHIFLDEYIESWCPKEGPIKHFMECVTVGLSKNPYMTVAEKRKMLDWYHQYFLKHESLLKEINAFGSVSNPIPVDGKID